MGGIRKSAHNQCKPYQACVQHWGVLEDSDISRRCEYLQARRKNKNTRERKWKRLYFKERGKRGEEKGGEDKRGRWENRRREKEKKWKIGKLEQSSLYN